MAETPRKVVRFERYLCVGCILVVLGWGEVPKYPKFLINIYLETISKKMDNLRLLIKVYLDSCVTDESG